MPNYAIQEQNQDMVSLLSAYFRLLYNPAHALVDAISMLKVFPGLVGLWPGSGLGLTVATSIEGTTDQSGFGLHLTRNGNARVVPQTDSLVTYMNLDGTNGYFSYADATAFDLTGATPNTLAGSFLGVTLGGWFYVDALPGGGSTAVLIGKANSPNNFSYWIEISSGGVVSAKISNAGNATDAQADSAAVSTGTWIFVCMRFDPSTSLDLFINDTETQDTSGVPATIFNGNAQFQIGARQSGSVASNFFDGRAAFCFLCAADVPDQFINIYYQMTAPLFGISI